MSKWLIIGAAVAGVSVYKAVKYSKKRKELEETKRKMVEYWRKEQERKTQEQKQWETERPAREAAYQAGLREIERKTKEIEDRKSRLQEEAESRGSDFCCGCETEDPSRCEKGHCLHCADTCSSGHCQQCYKGHCGYCGYYACKKCCSSCAGCGEGYLI